MDDYRIVIPSAGTGSRLDRLSRHVNKALVTLGNKPIISHIIEKFPVEREIVIALGYRKETLKDYLLMAHPERKLLFVEIDIFEGENSGLGYTLLQCREYLQCPFIFCSNDTIVLEDIPGPDRNWMGYAESADTSLYRSIRIRDGLVYQICGKGASGDARPYIGLAGIKNYKEFWAAMEKVEEGSIEIGESFGLRFLIKECIVPRCFTWFDTGNLHSLNEARKFIHGDMPDPNILEKENEAIWFINDKVVKFSTCEKFISNRVERMAYLKGYVPEIISYSRHMYAYKKVEGDVFSKNPLLSDFKYFLEWMQGFWQYRELDNHEKHFFRETCVKFYRDKTYERVKEYFTRFEELDAKQMINGKKVPRLYDILSGLDWDYIADGIPVRFHGDLHFENILITRKNGIQFTLLDWRQDFGGLLEYGDIYYDFAKLNHGLVISHELVKKNLFEVEMQSGIVNFDFLRKHSLAECENYFKEYLFRRKYDIRKVEIMTALIFLNIAALHHYPYSMLLFYLGKSMLYDYYVGKTRLESSHDRRGIGMKQTA